MFDAGIFRNRINDFIGGTLYMKPNHFLLVAILLVGMMFSIGGVCGIGTYPNVDSNMVLYYHFNNDSLVGENYISGISNNVFDYSPSSIKNGTTKNNMTYNQTGGFLGDGAFNFNGSQYIDGKEPQRINYNNSFSVMAWAIANNKGTNKDIVSKYFRTFEIQVDSNNMAHFTVWHSNVFENTTDVSYNVSNSVLSWNHYTGVWNGTHALLYLNGNLVNSTLSLNPYNVYLVTNNLISVGSRGGSSLYWNGSIDEVIVYNNTQTAEEISNNFRRYNITSCNMSNIISGCILKVGINNLPYGNYYLNDTSGFGAFGIMDDNVHLNCNGANIYGNAIQNSTGVFIYNPSKINVTITNCNINNYYNGIDRQFPVTGGRRSLFNYSNNNFLGITYMGINFDGVDNGTLKNNSFSNMNYTAIRMHSDDNTNASNNKIIMNKDSFAGIFNDGRNNNIYNNNITIDGSNSVALRIERDVNLNMTNNNYYNNSLYSSTHTGYGFYADEFHFNNKFLENTFDNFMYGMSGFYNNTNISSNVFKNIYLPIVIKNTDFNSFFYNNSFSDTQFQYRSYTGGLLPLYSLSNSLIVYDNQTSIPVFGTNQEINLTLTPNQYVYVYTNTTTICDETNTTCYMNITGMNTLFNETADGSLNLTFTDNDVNFLTKWYNWLVDGVSYLSGLGQNVFTYVFHLNASDNNSTVNMLKDDRNINIIDDFNTNTQENINSTIWQTPDATGGAGKSWKQVNVTSYGTDYNASEVTFTTPGYREYTTQTINKYNISDGIYSFNFSLWGAYGDLFVLLHDKDIIGQYYNQGNYTGIKLDATTNFKLINTYNNGTERTLFTALAPNPANKTMGTFRLDLNYSGQSYKLYYYNGTLASSGSINIPNKEYYITMVFGLNDGNLRYAWFDDISLTKTTEETNTTFLIIENISAPTITLNYPTALIDYGKLNGTLQLNFTAIDINLDKVWYNYNGTNVTIAGAVSGVYNLSNITLSTKKNVTIYANDTAGNLNATTFSWDYKVFENSRTINTPTVETTLETFSINLTSSVSLTSVYLNWNGTEYSTTQSNEGVYTKTLTIPAISSTETIPVYWRFYYNGTNISSSTTNQIVNKLTFQLCNATINQTLINFTTRSAENPFPLVNSSFKSNWQLSASRGATPTIYNYEDLVVDNYSYAFCTNTNTTTFYVTAEIEYSGTGYATNFYYLNDAELIATNTQNISLYLLNDSKATTTVLRVEDTAQKPFEDYTVQIQSYDVGTGTFYTVGMANTDYKGEDVIYLNWYDTLYKFIVLDESNNVVKTTGTTKITGTPTIIEITTDIEFVYDKFQNFVYTLYYDNTTQNFVLTYTMPSGEVNSACLRVYKEDPLNQTLICDTCETSSSATVFCNIASYGNGRFTAVFYALGSHQLIDWIDEYIGGFFQEQIYAALGNEDASFYAFLFAGIITVALFVNAVFGIIALMIGLIGASALGFTAIQWSEMMGVIIVGGFIIWIIKR